jgi:hypothetical protein
VRIGQRRRRPIFIAVGSAAALLPMATIGVVLFATLTGAELNTYKPLGLLLWEARRPNDKTAAAAAEEIHGRFQRGALEPARRQTVIDTAIGIQRDPSLIWSEKWGDVIAAAHTSGDIDKDQFAEFGAQAAVLESRARPAVAAGEDIPIAILLKEARVGSGHMFWGTMHARNVTVNGHPTWFQISGASAPMGAVGTMTSGHVGWVQLMGSTGGWGTPSNGGASLIVGQPQGLQPGDAEVTLTIDLNVKDQTAMQAGTTVWETGEDAEGPNFRRLELALPFRIVPEDRVMAREIPADTSTTERMMSSIVPGKTWVHRAGWGDQQQVMITFSIHNPPVPFAYEIFLRDGEREWPAGQITSDEYALDQGWGAWAWPALSAARRTPLCGASMSTSWTWCCAQAPRSLRRLSAWTSTTAANWYSRTSNWSGRRASQAAAAGCSAGCSVVRALLRVSR